MKTKIKAYIPPADTLEVVTGPGIVEARIVEKEAGISNAIVRIIVSREDYRKCNTRQDNVNVLALACRIVKALKLLEEHEAIEHKI